MMNTQEKNLVYYHDGVVDVGIIVVSFIVSLYLIFSNPLQKEATRFIADAILQIRKVAIPLTAIIGAYHIATKYLKPPRIEIKKILVKMLETRSRAFYSYLFIEQVIDGLEYAIYYRVESWDGYLIKLVKSIGNNVIYTIDEEFKKIRDIVAINPFPQDLYQQYQDFIRDRVRKERFSNPT